MPKKINNFKKLTLTLAATLLASSSLNVNASNINTFDCKSYKHHKENLEYYNNQLKNYNSCNNSENFKEEIARPYFRKLSENFLEERFKSFKNSYNNDFNNQLRTNKYVLTEIHKDKDQEKVQQLMTVAEVLANEFDGKVKKHLLDLKQPHKCKEARKDFKFTPSDPTKNQDFHLTDKEEEDIFLEVVKIYEDKLAEKKLLEDFEKMIVQKLKNEGIVNPEERIRNSKVKLKNVRDLFTVEEKELINKLLRNATPIQSSTHTKTKTRISYTTPVHQVARAQETINPQDEPGKETVYIALDELLERRVIDEMQKDGFGSLTEEQQVKKVEGIKANVEQQVKTILNEETNILVQNEVTKNVTKSIMSSIQNRIASVFSFFFKGAANSSGENDDNKTSLWLKGSIGRESFKDENIEFKSSLGSFAGGLDHSFNQNLSVGLFGQKGNIVVKDYAKSVRKNDINSFALGGYARITIFKNLSLTTVLIHTETEQSKNKSVTPATANVFDIRANYNLQLTQKLILSPIIGYNLNMANEFSYMDSTTTSDSTNEALNTHSAIIGASIATNLELSKFNITPEIHILYNRLLGDPKAGIKTSVEGVDVNLGRVTNIQKDTWSFGGSVSTKRNDNEITVGVDHNRGANGDSTIGYVQMKISL